MRDAEQAVKFFVRPTAPQKGRSIKTIRAGTVAASVPCHLWQLGTSNVVEGTYSPRLRIPWHRHPLAHCTYVLDGSYFERSEGLQAVVRRGDLLFHPKSELHCDLIGDNGARCLNIEFVAGDPLVPALGAMNRRVSDFSIKLRHAARRELSKTLPTDWRTAARCSPIEARIARSFY